MNYGLTAAAVLGVVFAPRSVQLSLVLLFFEPARAAAAAGASALGALVAGAFVWWGYENIYSYIHQNLPFLPLLNNNYMMVLLIAANLLVGIVLGALGSVFAVRKHLKI